MFVFNAEMLSKVRSTYRRYGRERAASVLCEYWRGLDMTTALSTVEEALCWRTVDQDI
ncbi:MAG: hypothetical protein WCJ64_26770 [Rhodospirillaceae bacterium]